MNQIFRWSPAVREKGDGNKFGVFQCKCSDTTPGAKRHVGESPITKWDFWAIDATTLKGKVVWIDKTFSEFNNKTVTNIILALQTAHGDIDILQLPFDGFTLRNVMNHVCGLRDSIYDTELVLTHGVWKKKEDGKVVVGNDGKPVWSRTLNFDGVAPFYPLSKDVDKNYWDFREEKGLVPVKTTNRKGETEYDDSKELAFWDKSLVSIQKKLVEFGIAIPFSYNSWVCGDIENPTGGGNQPEDIVARVKDLYEIKVKGQYTYFNRNGAAEMTADDVRANLRSAPPQPAPVQQRAQQTHAAQTFADANFPTEEPHEDPFVVEAMEGDPLPF